MGGQGTGKRILIFLDIDGVVNNAETIDKVAHPRFGYKCTGMDPELVCRLNSLVGQGEWILSSTWRKIFTLEQMNKMMKARGFLGELVGHTSWSFSHTPRGHEIGDYLMLHQHEIENYVILDDDDEGMELHLEHFVQTVESIGLTEENVLQALDILQNKRFTP